jgi:LAO/AO transport system kinase
MLAHSEDQGVFIRSLASRGSRGGLADCALDMVDVFDAAGFEVILVETVGAGQTQTEILDLADAVVLVTAPGLGDDVQAIKGGIVEIPDVIVINQADRPGAERTKTSLQWLVESNGRPRILTAVATEGKGITELWESLEVYRREQLENERKERRTQRQKRRVRTLVERLWNELIRDATTADERLRLRLDAPEQEDPYELAAALISAASRLWLKRGGATHG